MSCNKEWEQIKIEYKEIPVPEHGMAQMEEAMERAAYHRSRRRKLTAYGAMAAALLLILFLPKSLIGGLASNSSAESTNMTTTGGSVFTENCSSDYSEEKKETNTSAFYDGTVEEVADAESDTGTVFDTIEGIGMSSSMPQMEKEESSELVIEVETGDSILSICLSEEEVKEINQEIFYQMELALEQSAFFGISEEQAYYINEDGLLVIVFKEGIKEFVIPKAIISITK